jgi:G6PDH family F420-dependent oxidoreductase
VRDQTGFIRRTLAAQGREVTCSTGDHGAATRPTRDRFSARRPGVHRPADTRELIQLAVPLSQRRLIPHHPPPLLLKIIRPVAGEPRAFGFHLVDARLHSVQHGAHRAGDRRYLPVVPVSPRDHRPGRGHRGDPVRRTVHPGVGAGERLNEHVTGRPFPSVRGRHEVLREALEVIRLLWQGGYQSYEGKHLQLEDARIFDLPETLPLIAVAASGLPSIAIAAESGDGLFATEPDADLVQSYRSAGSAASTGPCYGEVPLAWAPDADIAAQAVLETTRWALTGWKVMMSELPNPANSPRPTRRGHHDRDHRRHQGLVRVWPGCGPPPGGGPAVRRRWLDHLVLQNAGPDPDGFISFFTDELSKPLRALTPGRAA